MLRQLTGHLAQFRRLRSGKPIASEISRAVGHPNRTMSTAPTVVRLVANSVCIADRAAKIIRDVMKKGDLGIVEKTSKSDLQTEADRSAQRCIMASLHKQFDKIALFGEEDLAPGEQIPSEWLETGYSDEVMKHANKLPAHLKNVKDDEIVVWVDPVDGTAEYTQGSSDCQHNLAFSGLLDYVTVLIGIAVRGKAVGGVIHQPYYNYQAGPDAPLGRCIWAIQGIGAFGYTHGSLSAEDNIIATSRSHSNKCVTEAVEACDPSEVLRVGGSGHKVLLVLEGKAHAYIFASPGTKKWDTAAPEAVLHAAGGKLTDIHGKPMEYHHHAQRRNTGGVLATFTEESHQWYLEHIPAHVKKQLPTS